MAADALRYSGRLIRYLDYPSDADRPPIWNESLGGSVRPDWMAIGHFPVKKTSAGALEARALRRKLGMQSTAIQETWHPGTWRDVMARLAADRCSVGRHESEPGSEHRKGNRQSRRPKGSSTSRVGPNICLTSLPR